jgi:hypothetical protein
MTAQYGVEPPFEESQRGDAMSDIDELHNRIDAVENKVGLLMEGLAVTHTLAAMTDRDVAGFSQTLRAHTRVLNALRETQVEQGQALSGLRETQVEQGQALSGLRETQVEQGQALAQHTETLAANGQSLAEIVGKLDSITRHLGIAESNGSDPAQN